MIGRTRSHTRSICITSSYTAAYAALTLALGPFSYGLINIRLANILLGTIPIIGWPAIIGQALGVLITASVSPLGPIDLINVPAALFFSWMIWRMRSISVFFGLTLYSVGLGLTVTEAIHYVYGTGVGFLLPYVLVGIFSMACLGGYALYMSIRQIPFLTTLFEQIK